MKAVLEFIAVVLCIALGLGGGPLLGFYIAAHVSWFLGLLVALFVVGGCISLAGWIWDALTGADLPSRAALAAR